MLRSYLRQIFWSFVFPGDRPSAVLIAFAVIVNGIVLSACSAAWEAAADDGCTESSKGWLAAGAISDALHIVFAVYFVFAVRRRANRCDVVPLHLTVARFVLSDYGLGVYAVFCLWIAVWISVTYAHFPMSACNEAIALDDDLYGRDLCCVYCTVVSSVNVFYLFGVAAVVGCTLVTEGFRQPRWWHTILLQDLRRRELQALHEETHPRASIRANSNRDTDRDMRAAGIVVRGATTSVLSPHDELRQRRGGHQSPAPTPQLQPGRAAEGVPKPGQGVRRPLHDDVPHHERRPLSSSPAADSRGTQQRRRLQTRGSRRQHNSMGVRFVDYMEEECPAADEPSPLLAGEQRHIAAPPARPTVAPVVRPSVSVVPVVPGQKQKPPGALPTSSPSERVTATAPSTFAALHEDDVGFFIEDDDDDDEEFYIADHEEVLPSFPAERGNI